MRFIFFAFAIIGINIAATTYMIKRIEAEFAAELLIREMSIRSQIDYKTNGLQDSLEERLGNIEKRVDDLESVR